MHTQSGKTSCESGAPESVARLPAGKVGELSAVQQRAGARAREKDGVSSDQRTGHQKRVPN